MTVKANCARCGDITLTASQITVGLRHDEGTWSYAFTCPRCRVASAKPTSFRIAKMLTDAGCHVLVMAGPEEPRPDCGPLDVDAVIDFTAALYASDDIVAEAQ